MSDTHGDSEAHAFGPGDDLGISGAAAAVHQVLSGVRQATRVDLLIATLVEILASGSKSQHDLLLAVDDAWPASGITADDIDAALAMGCEPPHSLMLRSDSLEGPLWRLDDAGWVEVAASKAWADGLRRRGLEQLSNRARQDFRPCRAEETELWLSLLVEALGTGIRAAEAAYLGDVEKNEGGLRAKGFDRADIFRMLMVEGSADVSEFLRAAAVAALDPSDPFGNEIVNMISTTCVLHGHLARLDVAAAQALVGSLDGQSIVLDTPVLLALVSGDSLSLPLEQMIRKARSSGVRVVALEHYLEELHNLVLATRKAGAADDALLSTPEQRAAYIALAEGDDVVVAYARLRQQELVVDWDGFEDHVNALRHRLSDLGVEIRSHGNLDDAQVEQCRDALRQTLAENPRGRPRTESAIERDADTLAYAWRKRRQHARDQTSSSAWPGVWVLTHDRRLAPAYDRAVGSQDGIPLTLSPTSFTMLLARVRPVPEVGELTSVAASLFTRQIAERVAVRFPPPIAAQLAHLLAGAGGATDVRVAQFESIGDAIEGASAEMLAAEVMRRRLVRLRATQEQDGAIDVKERAAAAERIKEAEQAVLRMETLNSEAERRLAQVDEEADRLRRQLASALTPQEVQRLGQRVAARAVVAVLHLAAVIVLCWWGYWVSAILLSLTGLLLWIQTTTWSRDLTRRLRSEAISILADTAAVVGIVAKAIT